MLVNISVEKYHLSWLSCWWNPFIVIVHKQSLVHLENPGKKNSEEDPGVLLSTFFSIPNLMFCQQIYFYKGLLTYTIAEFKTSH